MVEKLNADQSTAIFLVPIPRKPPNSTTAARTCPSSSTNRSTIRPLSPSPTVVTSRPRTLPSVASGVAAAVRSAGTAGPLNSTKAQINIIIGMARRIFGPSMAQINTQQMTERHVRPCCSRLRDRLPSAPLQAAIAYPLTMRPKARRWHCCAAEPTLWTQRSCLDDQIVCSQSHADMMAEVSSSSIGRCLALLDAIT